jgi:hypothetical protein
MLVLLWRAGSRLLLIAFLVPTFFCIARLCAWVGRRLYGIMVKLVQAVFLKTSSTLSWKCVLDRSLSWTG